MNDRLHPNTATSAQARVCIFSQRGFQQLVSRCAEYEFEDLVCEIDRADLLAPAALDRFQVREKLAHQLARRSARVRINPGIREMRLDKDYDLFFMVCQFPRDLLSLNAVKGWRNRCRKAVCWIAEIWSGQVSELKNQLAVLSEFDHVVIPCAGTVESVRALIGDRCVHIPPGIDTVLFCPYPNPPERCVDVYSMGRKSTVTHQAILKMAQQGQLFYMYDSFESMQTRYPKQHRFLLASIAKRSRYFIVNTPKIDRTFETRGQGEVSYRLFEGAAAGTVGIGDVQKTRAFTECFDWPDAIIDVPFDSSNIAEVLADLDTQSARLERIRRDNVTQSLLRHDWAYRWRAVLEMVGLEPTGALVEREQRLRTLAEHVERQYNQDSALQHGRRGPASPCVQK